MSNPTSNFNWQMPTATDLVTDLPADFEVFGQAVDTSLADLKGGTTGQVLKKNTNADMDFVWGAVAGDIEGVTAGVGISGGGTSGTVTITNDMATTITAAGDIVVGTGSGTYDNLPIGTTDQVLTADTTVSPYKVKWAAAPSPDYTWTSFTPTWYGLTVGNGTQNSSYLQIGDIVFCNIYFKLGSTSSVTAELGFLLPVGASGTAFENGFGSPFTGWANDNGTGNWPLWGAIYQDGASSKTYIYAIRANTTYGQIDSTSSTIPFTWANTDSIIFQFSYKAA
jgi:hypothetical protein